MLSVFLIDNNNKLEIAENNNTEMVFNEVNQNNEETILQEENELQEVIAEYELFKENSILKEDFLSIGMEYGVTTEFMQQFFDDALIHKSDGIAKQEPINYELNLNEYDFDSIETIEDRKYYQDENTTAYLGIDVSKYQGDIDWEKVANTDIEFAIIRVGFRGYGEEGKLVVDEYFHENIQGAIAAEMPVGVYFFSQAITTEEAVEEAEFLLNEIEGYNIDLPIIIDIEAGGSPDARTNDITKEQYTDFAIAFCDRIEQEGLEPMIYTSGNWFFNKLDMERLQGYYIWLAQYYKEPFFPYDVDIWQYTYEGIVDGIDGPVDLNLAFTDFLNINDEDDT